MSSLSAVARVAEPSHTHSRRRANGFCCWNETITSGARKKTGKRGRSMSMDGIRPGRSGATRQGNHFILIRINYVGGNTKFYGAALFRLRKEDFGEIRHYGGISPSWPIDYEDLEPYYTKAEHLYDVHGERGVDPTEPPTSADYPYPPVSHESRIQQLNDDFRRLGLNPFHVPLGIMLNEQNYRVSTCIRCNTCDGHPCLVNAKSDAQVVCVDPAIQYPHLTLLTIK